MFSKAHNVLVFLSILALSGCGFQMQGAFSAPQGMERLYIDGPDNYSLFVREFRTRLQDAGVELTDSRDDATATFTLVTDDTDQRVLSVSARNVPTEYEVYYTITYALDAGEEALLPQQTLTLTRDYTYDSTLVLGKAREEDLMRNAIVDDLVRVVMKQISTL